MLDRYQTGDIIRSWAESLHDLGLGTEIYNECEILVEQMTEIADNITQIPKWGSGRLEDGWEPDIGSEPGVSHH